MNIKLGFLILSSLICFIEGAELLMLIKNGYMRSKWDYISRNRERDGSEPSDEDYQSHVGGMIIAFSLCLCCIFYLLLS